MLTKDMLTNTFPNTRTEDVDLFLGTKVQDEVSKHTGTVITCGMLTLIDTSTISGKSPALLLANHTMCIYPRMSIQELQEEDVGGATIRRIGKSVTLGGTARSVVMCQYVQTVLGESVIDFAGGNMWKLEVSSKLKIQMKLQKIKYPFIKMIYES